ncbi:MAG TPA: lysine biosynthesis protein LysX [Thermoanaerobaculia bacterium]|nr:lysine biosynthesis protein LysX [Thermoanaerobaculia bacterium]
MRIGVLYSRVRAEEKLLFEALASRGLDFDLIDDRTLVLDVSERAGLGSLDRYDVVVERCINHSRALHTLRILNDHGVPTVNSAVVADVCGNKLTTTSALAAAGVPTPTTLIAYTPRSALEAIDRLGYPVVLKPAVGSWGRLLAKINDRDAAEALLEHKETLGTYHHSIFYIQRYVDKPARDIRAFVVGNETIAAIYRRSEHWITNTARGGVASRCAIDEPLDSICRAAAKAVGGGIVAIDLVEDPDQGLQVLEVNYTMEFRNSIEPTGVDIPSRMVDFIERVGRDGWEEANA